MPDRETGVTSVTTLVNVVGSGDLDRELDLGALYQLFRKLCQTEEVSKSNSRVTVSFKDIGGTISIFRTGKYNIMGCRSHDVLVNANDQLKKILTESDVIDSSNAVSFSPTNYVYTVDFQREINLNSFDVLLGAEAEYEPEQYPFLIYRPSSLNCTMTISSSGKCVVNSPEGREPVEKVLDLLKAHLKG